MVGTFPKINLGVFICSKLLDKESITYIFVILAKLLLNIVIVR